MKQFLHIQESQIKYSDTNIRLKGVNLGGWLMMEGYILHALNHPVRSFEKGFIKSLGKKTFNEFREAFLGHFIREQDIQCIANMGFNCVRVPFHYKLIENKPYRFQGEGLKYLDRVVRWAKRHKVWIILDLHAACGSQNHDWHSDSDGQAALWHNKSYRQRTVLLWEFLAGRYREEETIAGYDLLNEPVLDDSGLLNDFYRQLIAAIRKVDTNHILFVEGRNWSMDIECLDRFDDDNLALSVHFYHPLEYTMSLIPLLSYPLRSDKGVFDKLKIKKMLKSYALLAQKRKRPVFVGEFGINYREGFYGEDKWLRDILSDFEEYGFHWSYWTYKAVKNAVFPDGLFSYTGNPPWVNRLGPRMGWDNYAACWPEKKKGMIASWLTKNYQENLALTKVTGAFLKRTKI
jgi:aryl-phospho-beta-D-glucosidase BglC (GH1 family)